MAEIGVDRLLFGTDTPLYSAATQKARIETAEISSVERQAILYDNALDLLRSLPKKIVHI